MPVHLYGVVGEGARAPDQDQPIGRGGRPVRVISHAGVRALVGDIDEEARAGRDDLLAHAHVLESVAAESTVIPARFGHAFPDDEHVRSELLEAGHQELTELLTAFEGLIQLTVQARYVEEAALREVLRRDPDLLDLRDAAAAPGAGQELQLRLGEAVAAALDRLTQEEGDRLLERVAPFARAVSVNETRAAHDVLNVALLVERDRQHELDEAVTALVEEVSPAMTVRYVGPQPAYSFLEPVQRGELAWA